MRLSSRRRRRPVGTAAPRSPSRWRIGACCRPRRCGSSKPRRALLVYGGLPPARIRLRPWFRSRRLVSLAMAVDAAVPHPAMQVDDLAPVEVLRPTDEDGRPPPDGPPPHPEGNGARPVSQDRRPATSASGPPTPPAGGVSRLDRVTLQLGVTVAVVIAVCSYAVSATSLYALGVQAGYSWWQAAAVPVVADGPAIYGMFRIVSRSRRGAKGAGYGWLLVSCGTLASIGGNVAHAHRIWSPKPLPPPSPSRSWPCWRASKATPVRSPAWPPRPLPTTGRARSSRPASLRRPRPSDAAIPPINPSPSGPSAPGGRRWLPGPPNRPRMARSGRGYRRPTPNRGPTARPGPLAP